MTIKLQILAAALALAALGARAEENASAVAPYVETAVGAMMPQGGSRFERSAAVSVRLGATLSDAWAAEVEGGAAPRRGVGMLAVRALWRFAGYERLDPFLSVGWSGFFAHRCATGPEFGAGAWYYLSDVWSVRGDIRCVPCVDDSCRTVSSAVLGIGCAF